MALKLPSQVVAMFAIFSPQGSRVHRFLPKRFYAENRASSCLSFSVDGSAKQKSGKVLIRRSCGSNYQIKHRHKNDQGAKFC
jgi:hypothetical protein